MDGPFAEKFYYLVYEAASSAHRVSRGRICAEVVVVEEEHGSAPRRRRTRIEAVRATQTITGCTSESLFN